MLITADYTELNRELHQSGVPYGISSGKWAPTVHKLALACQARTVLDYGCGRGLLKAALLDGRWSAPMLYAELPYEVIEYDPAIEGKETKPAKADLVVCTDVLEHIEPDCLSDVLDDLAATTQRAILLVVSTIPAAKTLADGRNAHLIVEPARFWLPRFWSRWEFRLFEHMGSDFKLIAVPLSGQ